MRVVDQFACGQNRFAHHFLNHDDIAAFFLSALRRGDINVDRAHFAMPFSDMFDVLNDVGEAEDPSLVHAFVDFFDHHVLVTDDPDAGRHFCRLGIGVFGKMYRDRVLVFPTHEHFEGFVFADITETVQALKEIVGVFGADLVEAVEDKSRYRDFCFIAALA